MTFTEDELLERITVDPTIFGGKPIIRGMRMAVEHVLGMLAAGETPQRVLAEYPFLEAADIQACLAYKKGENTWLIALPLIHRSWAGGPAFVG